MRASPYPAPPACSDPAIGALATQALGRTPPRVVVAHLGTCLACGLQRLSFDRLDRDAVSPSPTLRDRLRRRLSAT